MYITILSLFCVRFLLYVVYVFALCSPYLEDNKVSIYLSNNLEVFKAAQSKLSHILTRPIRTSVERMGLGQACDSKRLNDCNRQGADQPSTRAGWPVPLLFTTVSVENNGFSNIL